MGTPLTIEGYEIVRELGRGAMGVVYLARDRLLERDVAIKVLHEAERGADAAERFLREARATARLSHPNVVTVYRAGVSEGEPYLVMELLRGRSLEAAVAADGPLPAARLLEVAIDAARGLAAAHARGIVHRDVKPSNLFETDERVVKVVDFGVAKMMAAPVARAVSAIAAGGDTTVPDVARVTEPDVVPASNDDAATNVDALGATRVADSSRNSGERTQISGTPLYMSPEVWREEGADHASDVWSLGATLFALATGAPPFAGRTIPEIAFRIMVATPAESLGARRTDLSPALVAVIDRALAKARARRYASAGELLAELERLARDARGPRTIVGSPYPGLRSMTRDDRDRFFGRTEDVTRVLERLRGEPLVVLVGPSGAGKSSLAAAGVAPEVAEGALGVHARWRILRLVPGRSPVTVMAGAIATALGGDPESLARSLAESPDALARALREHVARADEGVLVLLDQLEELVTLAEPAERDAAAAALGRLVDLAPSGVRVLATARSDLFDRLGALGVLGVALGRATELVRPLTGAALREALVEPARSVGARFEDESIVDGILAEAGSGEGALPLVAFAMRAWWDGRDRTENVLTREAWDAVGGVAGALGGHAEQVFAQLAPDDHACARAVFPRLVATDGTRRYATRAELGLLTGENPAALERVLVAFVRARLLLVEGEGEDAHVTIAHEALGRAWPRLVGWQTEGREDRMLHERLRGAAGVWSGASRRADLLWRGALLEELARWRVIYDDTLAETERAFADASARTARTARRRGIAFVAGGAVVLGSIALVATIAARHARAQSAQMALEIKDRAAHAERATRDRTAALAFALRETDPTAALAWLDQAASAAHGATPAMRAMALALEARGVAVELACDARPPMRDDGSRLACADDAGLWLVDLAAGDAQQIAPGEHVAHVALAERADRVAWVDNAGVLSVRDETGARRRVGDGVGGRPLIAMDAQGTAVLVLERATRQLIGVDVATGESRVLATAVLAGIPLVDVAVLHAGGGALLVAPDPTQPGVSAIVRYALTGPRGPGVPPTHALHAQAYARVGSLLAYTEDGAHLRVLDVDRGTDVPCAIEADGIRSIAVSPDGARVAWIARSAAAGATVDELGVADRTPLATGGACTLLRRAVPHHGADAVAFVPRADGSLVLAVVSHDVPLTAYNPADPSDAGTVLGDAMDPVSSALDVLATAPDAVLVVDRRSGRTAWRGARRWLAPPGLPGSRVVAAAIEPRGHRVVVLDADHRALIYGPSPATRVATARWIDATPGAAATRVLVAALPEGRVAVAAPRAGVSVLDVAQHRVEWSAPQPDATAVALEGSFALMALPDGTAARVDLGSRTIARGELSSDGAAPTVVAIARAGDRAAAVGTDGSITLRRVDQDAWSELPLRAFGELRRATALAVAHDGLAVAAARLGLVGSSGVTTLADAPGDFYERPMLQARFAPDSAVLLAGDDGTAWLVQCDDASCTVARASEPGNARALAAAGDDAFVAVAPGVGLALFDRDRGRVGVILPPGDDAPTDAIDMDDDALVLAGDARTGRVARLALPPADAAGFSRWIAARTNVTVGDEHAAPTLAPPPRALP